MKLKNRFSKNKIKNISCFKVEVCNKHETQWKQLVLTVASWFRPSQWKTTFFSFCFLTERKYGAVKVAAYSISSICWLRQFVLANE